MILFITLLMLINYAKCTIKERCPWLPRSRTDRSTYDPLKLTHCRDLGQKYGRKGRQGRVVFGVPPKAHEGGPLSTADLRHLAQQSKSIGRFLFPVAKNRSSIKILFELKVGHKTDVLPATVVASAESIFYGMNVAKVLIVLDMGQLCARDQFCKTKVKNLRQQNRILVFFINYNRGQNSFDDFEFVKSDDLIDNLRFNEMLADCVCKILDDGGHLVGDSTTTTLSTLTKRTGKLSITSNGHVIVYGADSEGAVVTRSPLFLILVLCCSAGAVLTILIAVLVLYSCREKRRRSSTQSLRTSKSRTDSIIDDVESNKNRKAKIANKTTTTPPPPPSKTTTTPSPPPKNNSNDRLYLKSTEYSPAAPGDQAEIKPAKKDVDHMISKVVKGHPIKKKMQNYERSSNFCEVGGEIEFIEGGEQILRRSWTSPERGKR
uniref:Uncharacterized protein n=1 Tax=Romanomermis culicivorax TaxID=13658 RepID=A0A915JYF7_ROMCU